MTHTTASFEMGLNAGNYFHLVRHMIGDGFLFFLKAIFTVCMSKVHLRSHVEVEVTPAMSQYFSQRAIVSLHNSTSSKQR